MRAKGVGCSSKAAPAPRERSGAWSTLIGAQTHAAYDRDQGVPVTTASTGNNGVQEQEVPTRVRNWAWSQGPRVVPLARTIFRKWLTALKVSHYEEDALVCFVELLTNAIRIQSPTLVTETKWILYEDRLRVEVADHSTEAPYLFNPDEESESGRGLLLVHFLADDWGYEHTHFSGGLGEEKVPGKVVWFELHK